MRSAFRRAAEYTRPAFQAVQHSPVWQSSMRALKQELLSPEAWVKDTDFTEGLRQTIERLPAVIDNTLTNSKSVPEAIASVARDVVSGTLGNTSKGKIVGHVITGVGKVVAESIDAVATSTANSANQLTLKLSGMQQSLARTSMDIMKKEPEERPRLGGHT